MLGVDGKLVVERKYFTNITGLFTVADLGFPRGGCANPKGGANPLFA